MTTINLRDYYPFYTSDCFIEVSEEIAAMLREADRKEAAYRLRTYIILLTVEMGLNMRRYSLPCLPMRFMNAKFPCRNSMRLCPLCRINRQSAFTLISFLV